jgi:hypothetical protein
LLIDVADDAVRRDYPRGSDYEIRSVVSLTASSPTALRRALSIDNIPIQVSFDRGVPEDLGVLRSYDGFLTKTPRTPDVENRLIESCFVAEFSDDLESRNDIELFAQ